MIHRYFDSGYHCFETALHVDLSRRFCISAMSERGSAHEYVVKLLALLGCVVRRFVVVLLFVERVRPVSVGVGLPSVSAIGLCCFALRVRVFRCIWSQLLLFRRLIRLARWGLRQSTSVCARLLALVTCASASSEYT